eukprot:TRINITY_DN11162_c0_g1_i1.p1 TRINITY_DN11162_c0_g1~~TRINITY_DN11162_c0_g1_i1.p1  ORF type:complete len:162 (-),score=23.82 TRINITY_DN11162_c0_g1_i1:17-472(-)
MVFLVVLFLLASSTVEIVSSQSCNLYQGITITATLKGTFDVASGLKQGGSTGSKLSSTSTGATLGVRTADLNASVNLTWVADASTPIWVCQVNLIPPLQLAPLFCSKYWDTVTVGCNLSGSNVSCALGASVVVFSVQPANILGDAPVGSAG